MKVPFKKNTAGSWLLAQRTACILATVSMAGVCSQCVQSAGTCIRSQCMGTVSKHGQSAQAVGTARGHRQQARPAGTASSHDQWGMGSVHSQQEEKFRKSGVKRVSGVSGFGEFF